MAIAGKDKRTFFSLQAAADLIVPIINTMDAKAFDATKFQVLARCQAQSCLAILCAEHATLMEHCMHAWT